MKKPIKKVYHQRPIQRQVIKEVIERLNKISNVKIVQDNKPGEEQLLQTWAAEEIKSITELLNDQLFR